MRGWAAGQLAAYFAGERRSFDLPVSPGGTEHDRAVWQAIRDIPPGETRTYGEVARTVGSSPRAVGNACGRNPLPIVVPCHRVVGANVVDGDGKAIGSISLKQIIDAIARPAEDSDQEARYR